MDKIIEILMSEKAFVMFTTLLGAVVGAVLTKLNIDILKPIKVLNKAIRTPFTANIITITAFVLKYLLPAFSIAFLSISAMPVDKYFVFSMCFCFAVLILSIVRDALLNFTLKTLDAIEADRAERMQKASEEIRRHDKR